ncbi:response regulator [Acidobacteriota bacterium]
MRNVKILLIDDDQWIRNSLRMFFQDEGCSFIALETAEEGLERMAGNHFDIVIADYRLPGMNGLKFLKRVQILQPNTAQILITEYRDYQIKSEAAKLGIQDLLDKPISAETLESSISYLISKKSRLFT